MTRFLDGSILEDAMCTTIPLVYETDDYCIIDKPKWVLSHPNSVRDMSTASVVASLYHHYKKKLPSMWGFIRSGLVHRLDKETDWLMIVALSEHWLRYFRNIFQQKTEEYLQSSDHKSSSSLIKWYTAICSPRSVLSSFPAPPFVIDMIVYPNVSYTKPKRWITIIKNIIQLSWFHVKVDIELGTWRTHQIRYHLNKIGLPIVWDYLYDKNQKINQGKPELQLKSSFLTFRDMNNNLISIVKSWSNIQLSINNTKQYIYNNYNTT